MSERTRERGRRRRYCFNLYEMKSLLEDFCGMAFDRAAEEALYNLLESRAGNDDLTVSEEEESRQE